MQGEVEVVECDVELHAYFFTYGFRADHVYAERRMKQCAELGAGKIVRRMGRVICKRARAVGKGMTLLRWTGGALSGCVSKLSIDCVRAI